MSKNHLGRHPGGIVPTGPDAMTEYIAKAEERADVLRKYAATLAEQQRARTAKDTRTPLQIREAQQRLALQQRRRVEGLT